MASWMFWWGGHHALSEDCAKPRSSAGGSASRTDTWKSCGSTCSTASGTFPAVPADTSLAEPVVASTSQPAPGSFLGRVPHLFRWRRGAHKQPSVDTLQSGQLSEQLLQQLVLRDGVYTGDTEASEAFAKQGRSFKATSDAAIPGFGVKRALSAALSRSQGRGSQDDAASVHSSSTHSSLSGRSPGADSAFGAALADMFDTHSEDAGSDDVRSITGSEHGLGHDLGPSATEEDDPLYGCDLDEDDMAPLVAAEQLAAASRPASPPLVHLSHPEDLPPDELVEAVKPSDAALALCALYANRWHTQKRLEAAAKLLQQEEVLQIYDQFEDRKVGMRMVTFISPVKVTASGHKVAAAVFTFRGTRADKFGNIRADFQVLKDRNADLFITQRGIKHVRRHIQRLSAEFPDVQWGFFATGHSLGGFTATTCTILCDRILHCTTFEAPGLTTFYQKLAGHLGDEEYWRGRVTNYLGIPNPITMVNRHLGRLFRVHLMHIQCRTDVLHMVRCLFGTATRVLNWMLLAQATVRAAGLVFGIPASAWACTGLLAGEGSFEMVKVLLMRECSVEMVLRPAHLASSAYWTLRNAGAYVAGKLGATAAHLYQQHSMWHMAASFNPKTGVPHRYVEMASWPRMERVSGMFGVSVRRALLESFWPTQSCEGVCVMFNRNAMIEARVAALPGYEELVLPEPEPQLPFWGEDMPFWDPRGLLDVTAEELSQSSMSST